MTFVTQDAQEGFAHPVHAARAWVDGEPFLLMLGDHLYASDTDVPCARQVLDIYHQHDTSAVGLMRTPEARVAYYGAVRGRWADGDGLLTIGEFQLTSGSIGSGRTRASSDTSRRAAGSTSACRRRIWRR